MVLQESVEQSLSTQLQKISDFVDSGKRGSLPTLSEGAITCLYASAHEFYVNGKYETAHHYFHILTVLEPYAKRNWMGLAATLHAQKDYKLALEGFSMAAVLDVNDPYPCFHAAECFFFLGEIEKGFEALDAAEAVAVEHGPHPLLAHLDLMRKGWQNCINLKGGKDAGS